jgi:prophage regulatory protein
MDRNTLSSIERDNSSERHPFNGAQSATKKFLRFPAVRELTGLSRTTIWRLERRGEFPNHVKLSTNIVGWIEQEVMDWMRSKAQAGTNARP